MRRWQVMSVAILVACLATGRVMAAELKLATINMERVFTDYYKTKAADAKIKEAREELRDKLKARDTDARAVEDKYNEARKASQNPLLNEADQKAKLRESEDLKADLQDRVKALRNFEQTEQQALMGRYENARKILVDEILEVVRDYATSNQFDLVLDNSGMTSNRLPAVVFAKAQYEISDEILARLNQKAPAASKPAEPADATPAPGK